MNDQKIEVLNTNDCIVLSHFNIVPTTSRLLFIREKKIKFISALNASDIAILIKSWPFDLDLDVQH